MNFSFSDVKTSIDKTTLFDKNQIILYTEYPQVHEMLEMASQEDDDQEDNDYEIDPRVIVYSDQGSENAPEDSAYISDEQNCQEKIINESSLMDDNDD